MDGYGADGELLRRLVEASERTATANEKLIELATEERQVGDSLPGPPFCPHCGTFDPIVRSEGGRDHMGKFVLVGQCDNCHNILFGLPSDWQMFQTIEQVREAMRESEDDKNGT